MSVILDALQKARTDRRKNPAETHPNSVAKVLEPALNGPTEGGAVRRTGKGWVVPVSIIFAVMCLLALAGGAFFMLYDQIRRMEKPATVAPQAASAAAVIDQPVANAVVPVAVQATPAAVSQALPAALSTPVPLAELPVQAPVTSAAPAVSAAGEPGVVAGMKLGSIACEANEDDCIAHINGRIVKVGDRVKQYHVMKITADAVTLRGSAGDVVTLSLFD